MSGIYLPKWIFMGAVGYLGVLYISSVIDKRREKPKVNVVNLAHLLPNLYAVRIDVDNVHRIRDQFYKSIDQLQHLIEDLCSQKKQIITDLKQQGAQKPKSKPKQNNKAKSNNVEQNPEQLAQHTKINYVHRNKIIFENYYFYGLMTVPQQLNFQDQCNRLMYNEEGLKKCYVRTSTSENRIRNHLYRNQIGNEV